MSTQHRLLADEPLILCDVFNISSKDPGCHDLIEWHFIPEELEGCFLTHQPWCYPCLDSGVVCLEAVTLVGLDEVADDRHKDVEVVATDALDLVERAPPADHVISQLGELDPGTGDSFWGASPSQSSDGCVQPQRLGGHHGHNRRHMPS
jgi:hypothetical protein